MKQHNSNCQDNTANVNYKSIFENLITIAEFCRITKFSTRTVYNWIHREAEFPYIKWGTSIRLEFPKVISWLEARS